MMNHSPCKTNIFRFTTLEKLENAFPLEHYSHEYRKSYKFCIIFYLIFKLSLTVLH